MKLSIELITNSYKRYLREFDTLVRTIGYRTSEKGCMQRKVQEYLHYLEKNGILKITKVDAQVMIAYYEYLCERPNVLFGGFLSASSISEHMGAIDIFNQDLLEKGIIKKIVSLPKRKDPGDKKERDALSELEMAELYKMAFNKRDIIILHLAYGCGLRMNEIKQLEIRDIRLSNGIIVVRSGKNSKRRDIPIPNRIVRDFKDYLLNERYIYIEKNRRYENETFVINNEGKSASGAFLNNRIEKMISKMNRPEIEAKGITLHCLRHSIATHLLDRGATIEFVRDFLGHAEIDTVHIYAKRRKLKQLLYNRINH